MSGEFGAGNYRGFVQDVVRQVGDRMTFGIEDEAVTYEGTRIIGRWMSDWVAPLIKRMSYNEECDSHPSENDLRTIDGTIAALQKARDDYAEWLKTTP